MTWAGLHQVTGEPNLADAGYQEGLDSSTGTCPIHSSGFYAAKHDPFVFFQDVSGSPPSATNASCVAHHRAYSSFAGDLAAGDVASYTFITPDLCHDMHGASGCPDSNMPFLAIGPGVKPGFTGTVTYNHSSIVKSIEAILDLPTLSTVSSANDLSNLFNAGQYP